MGQFKLHFSVWHLENRFPKHGDISLFHIPIGISGSWIELKLNLINLFFIFNQMSPVWRILMAKQCIALTNIKNGTK